MSGLIGALIREEIIARQTAQSPTSDSLDDNGKLNWRMA